MTDCPKRMHYGPCGGVRDDGGCEMRPQPCPFATLDAAPAWTGSPAPSRPPVEAPVVLTDLTLPAYDPSAVGEIVDVLAPTCDAVLVGEHQNRPDLPPALMAALIKERGVRPWITLTCRDRNRVVLEQELQGLAALGGVGVFCATGDGRAPGVRDEVTQVFDIDGTRLAGMAAHNGLAVGVPEAPDAPPRRLRARRLLAKQEAGAQVVVLNHVGTANGWPRSWPRRARSGCGCRSWRASPSTPTSDRPRCCCASPGSAWTPSGWRTCSPRATR
jgi:Methylene-tetrahydrofolate reductase C terminal